MSNRKYIPPHLRRKLQNDDRPTPTVSRRNDALYGRKGTTNTSPHGPSSSFSSKPGQNDARQGHQTMKTNGRSIASRWSNVDRNNLAIDDSSLSHRRPKTKYLFLGDSFVKMFGLVQSPYIQVKSFKGASAKGLGRETNENRTIIQTMVREMRPERVVFCFGSVDVHLSHYFTKVSKGVTLELKPIADAYLEFVNTLTDLVPPEQVTVVGIYASPLDDEDVLQSVCKYGSVREDQLHLLDQEEDVCNDARQERVRRYNRHLQEGCTRYGFQFDDLYDQMVDPITNKMKPSFRDVADKNIHVVWETTILLWLEQWPWYKELAPAELEEELQKTLEEYLKTKPWAERTHLASTVGVLEAIDKARGTEKEVLG